MHKPDVLKATVIIGEQEYSVKDLTQLLQNTTLDAVKSLGICIIKRLELIIVPNDFPLTLAVPKEDWARAFYPQLPQEEYQIAYIWTCEYDTVHSTVYRVSRKNEGWWHTGSQMNISSSFIARMRKGVSVHDASFAELFGARVPKDITFSGDGITIVRL